MFFDQLQNQILLALIIEDCVWYIGCLRFAFEMSYDTRYLSEAEFCISWKGGLCPLSFWKVCNGFDHFRTNLWKHIGRYHRKKNTNFPIRRWVVSKKSFWPLLCWFLKLELKMLLWEIPKIFLQVTRRVSCSSAK